MLGKHSGRHAVKKQCQDQGYDLTRFELDRGYREVIALADRQKSVSAVDLSRIVETIRTAAVQDEGVA